MKVVALIVTSRCADLLRVCLASLRHFAPEVEPRVVVNDTDHALTLLLAETGVRFSYNRLVTGTARDHAEGIEHARRSGFVRDADIVILMDNDVAITSARWYPALRRDFQEGHADAWGGRHAEYPAQIHAHLFAMRQACFQRVGTFHAVQGRDTAGTACVELRALGYKVTVLDRAMLRTTDGLFRGMPYGWYAFPNAEGCGLWWHLGSGTHAHLGRMRWWWTWAKATLGRRRLAAKALERHTRRRLFIAMATDMMDEGGLEIPTTAQESMRLMWRDIKRVCTR